MQTCAYTSTQMNTYTHTHARTHTHTRTHARTQTATPHSTLGSEFSDSATGTKKTHFNIKYRNTAHAVKRPPRTHKTQHGSNSARHSRTQSARDAGPAHGSIVYALRVATPPPGVPAGHYPTTEEELTTRARSSVTQSTTLGIA